MGLDAQRFLAVGSETIAAVARFATLTLRFTKPLNVENLPPRCRVSGLAEPSPEEAF